MALSSQFTLPCLETFVSDKVTDCQMSCATITTSVGCVCCDSMNVDEAATQHTNQLSYRGMMATLALLTLKESSLWASFTLLNKNHKGTIFRSSFMGCYL